MIIKLCLLLHKKLVFLLKIISRGIEMNENERVFLLRALDGVCGVCVCGDGQTPSVLFEPAVSDNAYRELLSRDQCK